MVIPCAVKNLFPVTPILHCNFKCGYNDNLEKFAKCTKKYIDLSEFIIAKTACTS